MKKLMLIVTLIIGFQNAIPAQEVKALAKEAITKESIQEESFPIPGSHFLREKEQVILEYFEENPNAQRIAKTRSPAWNFTVGSTYTWWADSLIDNSGQYQVPSTCRAVGTNCYVFVEDAMWGTDRVNQAAVDAMVNAFDSTTPADAPNNDGIYNVDTRTFGAPPDVDNDPRIIILILDIQDGWSQATGGGYVAGYFYSLNERPDGTAGLRSNVCEIFYMDCNPAVLTTDSGRQGVLATTAHEFQHMIHFAHDEGEMTFINEGLSEIAEHVCGYGVRSNAGYTKNTNVNLLSWNQTGEVLDDYSRAALWTLYIYEQYPIGILKDFVNNHHSQWGDLDATLRTYNATRGFYNVIEEWLIANYVNGASADGKYKYQYSPLSKPAPIANYVGNPNGTGNGSLTALGAQYIKFTGGSDLNITFTGDNTIIVKALKIGSLAVEPVTKGVAYTPTGYGTTYPEVTFLVYNQSPTQSKNYSYVSTGTAATGSMELAYEDGVPEGYLKFVTGDSSAVFFSGVTGARLDSIKIAFRRSGSIQMDISEFDGQTNMRGATLYGPVQINSSDSTTVPYPVPYDNWVTVDLSGQIIDATNDFIVSFLIGNNPAEPGIMISSEPDDGVRNSRTYYKNDDAWYYISDSGNPGNIFKYLIRAYVSLGGTTILSQPAVTSIVANQGNIRLSWTTSGGPVAGYNIYRSTTTGFIPGSNNKVGFVGNAITSYTDEGPNIQANTTYYYRISSFDWDGNESIYSDEVNTTTLNINDKNGIPIEYSLNSNYPNPFNPSTTFQFATPKDGLVKFSVHDLLGRVIYTENRNLLAGNYSFTWDGQNHLNQQVVSGVYFLRMEAEGFAQTRKMLMMK